MAPQGRCGTRRGITPVMVLGVLLTAGTAGAAAKAAAKPPDMTYSLNAIIEAQRNLAVELAQLRDQLNALQRSVGEGHDEARQNRDELQAVMEQVKGMREEIRGLYLESSYVKGDIARVGKQVEDLDGSLGNFRLSAGIVVAVIVVLQVALVLLMLRGRG